MDISWLFCGAGVAMGWAAAGGGDGEAVVVGRTATTTVSAAAGAAVRIPAQRVILASRVGRQQSPTPFFILLCLNAPPHTRR